MKLCTKTTDGVLERISSDVNGYAFMNVISV